MKNAQLLFAFCICLFCSVNGNLHTEMCGEPKESGIMIRVGKRWECRIRSVFLILCRKIFMWGMDGIARVLGCRKTT